VENINETKPMGCYYILSELEKNGKKVWKDTSRTELKGALMDLRINSPTIAKLDMYIQPFSWTAIAGTTENGVRAYDGDLYKLWKWLGYLCSIVPDASFPTLTNFPIFDGQNDRIVSLLSQFGNAPDAYRINNVDHSSVLKGETTVEKVRELIEKSR
jgi:hypothetical protein